MRTILSCFILLFLIIDISHAGVIIGGTRVIYNEGIKDATINLNNPDGIPYLVQSWVDTSESKPQEIFSITPPLFKLNGESNNTLRIFLTDNTLSNNKESLFWLNIKTIPAVKHKENSLQLAFRTKMKLIYRPTKLKEANFNELQKKIIWSKSGSQLTVKNPTPYYINFQQVIFNDEQVNDVSYVAPFSSNSFTVNSSPNHGIVQWELINDFGATTERTQKKI